jgi:hypothetical protein
VHSLKDDLESILYVVLYCALRWLPVDTSFGLDWWLNSFFAIYKSGVGGGDKALNAMHRVYTASLTTTGSRDILDWLNAAMDLHYHAEKGPDPARPNPAWDNGKALEAMWKETLANELPHDDRRENPIPNLILGGAYSFHATYTADATLTALFDSRNGRSSPPPPMLGPSRQTSRPLPTEGRITRSSKRRKVNKTRTPTAESTPAGKKSSRKRSAKK